MSAFAYTWHAFLCMYISNKVGTRFVYYTVYIYSIQWKRQFILMKGMSWKLLFPLQEIAVCLALEVNAFAVKEPVAGQPKAENKHFFQMFGCLFLGVFLQKTGPERSSSILGDISYEWFSYLRFCSYHGLFPHKTIPLKFLLLLFSRSSVRQLSITSATKLNYSILNSGNPLPVS